MAKRSSEITEINLKLGSWSQYAQYLHDQPPYFIDYSDLTIDVIPANWEKKTIATQAAKGKIKVAIWVGSYDISLPISESRMKDLASAKVNNSGKDYDNDGEYSTPVGQIPLSRLMDLDSSIYENSEIYDTISYLYALQSPISSPWGLPMARIFSCHSYIKPNKVVKIRLHVYFTRLLFELISDIAVQVVISRLQRSTITIKQVKRRPESPILFKSLDTTLNTSPEFQFSLAGLMKYSENQGYHMSCSQPTGLNVELYDFQRSTVQWMLDQELDEDGINAYFWEEWSYPEGYNMYYFPLAGEFRLPKPPRTNGGLLSEEMGLGKTIEIMSLILKNPLPDNATAPSAIPAEELDSIYIDEQNKLYVSDKIVSKATLIVVPPTLLSQWFNEFRTKLTGDGENQRPLRILRADSFQFPPSRYETFSAPFHDLRRPAFVDSNGAITPASEWGKDYDGEDIGIRDKDILEYRLPQALPEEYVVRVRALEAASKRNDFSFGYRARVATSCCVRIENTIDLLCSVDVVLTSYSSFRRSSNIYKKIYWHRIVLDECQEVKEPTTGLAKQCRDLCSSYRWMVSGTPLCSSIEDLHGELKFLKIWPFSLTDTEDGFWKAKIGDGFSTRDPKSLELLHALIDQVIIRHTKSQRYIDGRHLVNMPQRSIEWRSFPILDRGELYLIKYLEAFAADAFCDFIQSEVEFHQRHPDEDRTGAGTGLNYAQIRHLVSWICIGASAISGVPLSKLDELRRLVYKFQGPLIEGESGFVKVSPQVALALLQSQNRDDTSGLFHDSNRTQANIGFSAIEQQMREELKGETVKSLSAKLVEYELPIPTAWSSLELDATIREGTNVIICTVPTKPVSAGSSSATAGPTKARAAGGGKATEEDDDDNGGDHEKTSAKSQSILNFQRLKKGDEIRIESKNEHEELVIKSTSYLDSSNSKGLPAKDGSKEAVGAIELESAWELPTERGSKLSKRVESTRKEPYIDLIVAKRIQTDYKEKGNASETLHEQGFATLYKIMAGQSVGCPICLMPATSPVVTFCVHAYCKLCALDLLGQGRAKCAVCRRQVSKERMLEIDACAAAVVVDNSKERKGEEGTEGKPSHSTASSSSVAATETSEAKRARLNDNSVTTTTAADADAATSSSSQQTQQQVQQQVQSDDVITDDSIFITPTFNLNSYAPAKEAVDSYAPLHMMGEPRDRFLPSIEPRFLGLRKRCLPASFLSSRFVAVMKDIQIVLKTDPFAKFVIFSQFSQTIYGFQEMFGLYNRKLDASRSGAHGSETRFECALVDGHSAATDGQLQKFFTDPLCNVCLLTTGVAAVGLTLTMSYVCYILEPSFDTADEAQALGRVHRIGQSSRCVRCVIFYRENSCEERLLAMRQREGKLMSHFAENNNAAIGYDPEREKRAMSGATVQRKRARAQAQTEAQTEAEASPTVTKGLFTVDHLQTILGVSADRRLAATEEAAQAVENLALFDRRLLEGGEGEAASVSSDGAYEDDEEDDGSANEDDSDLEEYNDDDGDDSVASGDSVGR